MKVGIFERISLFVAHWNISNVLFNEKEWVDMKRWPRLLYVLQVIALFRDRGYNIIVINYGTIIEILELYLMIYEESKNEEDKEQDLKVAEQEQELPACVGDERVA